MSPQLFGKILLQIYYKIIIYTTLYVYMTFIKLLHPEFPRYFGAGANVLKQLYTPVKAVSCNKSL